MTDFLEELKRQHKTEFIAYLAAIIYHTTTGVTESVSTAIEIYNMAKIKVEQQ